MRVGREAFAECFLAKAIQLLGVQATFKKGARVDARCRMSLNEQQIASMAGGRGMKKVVEPDVVEGRR